MEKRMLEANYRFRPPKPSRFWQWVLIPLRRRVTRRRFQVTDIRLHGEDHVRSALRAGGGVMFAVNHPAHGDPFIFLEAMHRLKVSCCYMAGWQVFLGAWGLKGWAFQKLGAFSIDREGTDVRSFRMAVSILVEGSHSLVVFPEGEVYHLNDRVTPLREGAGMMGLTADRLRRRADGPPLRVVPCAIKYFYVDDPTPALESIMTRLETRISWRPRSDRSLEDRIYRYAEAALALKELEYLDEFGKGKLTDRIGALTRHILAGLESRRLGKVSKDEIPLRIKKLRHLVLQEISSYGPSEEDEPSAQELPDLSPEAFDRARRDLEDLHLVTQLFTYPGDYVAEKPSIERIAETIDKFEEDALGAVDAGARARRRAIVAFGPSIDVREASADFGKSARAGAAPMTAIIEQHIQQQLDEIAEG